MAGGGDSTSDLTTSTGGGSFEELRSVYVLSWKEWSELAEGSFSLAWRL